MLQFDHSPKLQIVPHSVHGTAALQEIFFHKLCLINLGSLIVFLSLTIDTNIKKYLTIL